MEHATILLVGSGQLGSRHLQAVAALDGVRTIHVVDPSATARALAQERLAEVADRHPALSVQWHAELPPAARGGDLCIVATQAAGRPELVKRVVETLGYRRFLIEKIVAQSTTAYEDLLAFCAARGVEVWVNCKTRAYGVHQTIKAKIGAGGPIIFSCIAGNQGLANNGVHAADLFAFYDGSQSIRCTASRLDATLHPSKRGPDIFDCSGTLVGTTERGSDCIIAFSGSSSAGDVTSILTPSGRFLIDHLQKFAWESTPNDHGQWHPIPIAEDWNVSHMTKAFVRDILTTGTCALPTLLECYPAHAFILDALMEHFARVAGRRLDRCPVT